MYPSFLMFNIRKQQAAKIIVCFLAVWIFSIFPSFAEEDTMNIHFIDVGYGDAILVELPNGCAILIDAGDREYAGHLRKYLISRKIKSLDAAFLTHPHKDHFSGFLSVLRKYPVGKFYINGDVNPGEEGYDDLIKDVEKRKIPTIVLKEKDEILLGNDETRLVVLHPSALEGSVNENALVFWLIFKETSFLLSSDIQERQQDELLERYPEIRAANGILVPHHGGRITGRFANAFRDDAVFIVSTGRNPYGKPFEEELDKLKGLVLRTDLDGAIMLKSDGRQVRVFHERH